jgi:hypothetical protein
MAAPAKLLHVIGLLLKEESVYGTAVALTTTADGVQMQFADKNAAGAPLAINYLFDGDLGPSVSNLGKTAPVAMSGRSVQGPLPFRSRPGGAAYSASVKPSLHLLLKAAGFDATLVTTGGSESWTYTPTAPGSTFTSLCGSLYPRGELWSLVGAIGNLKFDAPDTAPPIWTFDLMGLLSGLPTDTTAPSITYPLQSVSPPLASSISFTLGSLSANAVVKAHSFDLQRQMTPRSAQSGSGGHLGFVPGDRSPIMRVTLEQTAAVTGSPYTSSSAFDPYRLKENRNTIAVSLQHGSTQYFRQKTNFPQCTILDAVPGNDGPIATVELTICAHNSTGSSADDVNFVFD